MNDKVECIVRNKNVIRSDRVKNGHSEKLAISFTADTELTTNARKWLVLSKEICPVFIHYIQYTKSKYNNLIKGLRVNKSYKFRTL